MTGSWVAVASADHVSRGVAGGFMQVCHGIAAPLRRIRPGDKIFYYSPHAVFGGTDRLQAFTAYGVAKEGNPYPFDMGGGFIPYRRDVTWFRALSAPIRQLLDQLEFTRGRKQWGYAFRFGFFALSEADHDTIRLAMGLSRSS